MKLRQTGERIRRMPVADMARRVEETPVFFDAPAFFKRHKEEILEAVYAHPEDPYRFLSNLSLCLQFMPKDELRYEWMDWERTRDKLKREIGEADRGGWTLSNYADILTILDLFPERRQEMLRSLEEQIKKTEQFSDSGELEQEVLMARLRPEKMNEWMRKAKAQLPEAMESLKGSDPESTTDLARDVLLVEPELRPELQRYFGQRFDRVMGRLNNITDRSLANGVLTGLRLLGDLRILFAESAQLQPDGSVVVVEGKPKLGQVSAQLPDRSVA